MYTSMPWITDITAISVVVERIIPSSVRKLRSLLERSESNATDAASKKDAWEDFTERATLTYRIREPRETCSDISSTQSITSSSSQNRGAAAGDESEVAAVIHGDQPQMRILRQRRMIVNPRKEPADRPWRGPSASACGYVPETDWRIACGK